METVVYTHSPEETVALGVKVGRLIREGDIIAFKGGLGAGKTTFTHGLAQGMGLTADVSSPTFAIVNEYGAGGSLPLYHFDMYRISGGDELEGVGFYDYLDGGGAMAIEWSENISSELPENTTVILIETTGENSRRITIAGDERFDSIGD